MIIAPRQGSRHVLSFGFGDDEEDAKSTADAVRGESRKVVLLWAGETAPRMYERFADLRLDGESLLIVEADPPNIETIVKRLQGTSSASVFVVPPNLETPCKPGTEPCSGTLEAGSPQHWARQSAERRNHVSATDQFVRLKENQLALNDACESLWEATRLGHGLTAAAEWMLDNSYLVTSEIGEIRRHWPRDYRKILRKFDPGYDLAQELVARTENSLTEATITEWLREYQHVSVLTTAELWLFPLFLRMALIEALRQLGVRINWAQQLREATYLWANRLAASARRGTEEFDKMLARMETESIALEPFFITSLVEQLQDQESALAPLQHWIEDRLKTSVAELVRSQHTQEAAERVLIANAFGSLRVLSRIDFSKIFESVSLVEAQLRTDPSYALSDFATRDQCRRVVERISRGSGVDEVAVARRAVNIASGATDPRSRHVAYYLLGDGVLRLEQETGSRTPFRIRLIRALRRGATLEYLGGSIGLTVCFMALALGFAWEAGVTEPGLLIMLGILALFPLSELSIQITNAFIISLLPPDPLPKMDFREGIPAEHATLVVVPMMLGSKKVVCKEIEKLEIRFLANREPNLFFGLLSDYLDAPEQSMPSDGALLNTAREGIAALNARYPGNRFLLFHRDREWSPSEEKWIGRERKRGKIEALNRYLCRADSHEFQIEGRLPLPVRYVITLDADTQLPPTTARRMIEAIAHPLNRVEIHPESHVRRRGFTIIQPRISIALPDATATRFTRIFADTAGTDPYCQAVSDAHQDLFGEGVYHGKAIYDVEAFHTTVGNRFPSETLLSHDLIEGAHAGVALASDIELFEALPLDYVSFSKRQHRWIRGDWQIASWMFSKVPSAARGKAPNPLTVMNRWRILDNLRRSLVPVASMMLLVFGWLISAAPGVWSLVVGLAIAIPGLAPLLDRFARWLQGSVSGWRGATDELVQAAVMVAFLPHQAWVAVDAIARAMYRLTVSRRYLLEWQPAQSTGDEAHQHLTSTVRQMLAISLGSVVLMTVLRIEGTFLSGAIFLGLWVASPAILHWLSQTPAPSLEGEVSRADREFLRGIARRTWRYFDDLVNADHNWLPPDNSQLALRVEVAERTSPTNIGLWFGSALAAVDLGYLTTDEFLNRCAQTLNTIDRLERYEGHLLNWYDTKTLQALQPKYVSTVDSGNLIASLWVFEQGAEDCLNAPLLLPVCLRGMSDTLSVLREVSEQDPSLIAPIRAVRRALRGSVGGYSLPGRLRAALDPVEQLTDAQRWLQHHEERAYWTIHLTRELRSWIAVVDRYLTWMEILAQPPDAFLRTLGDEIVSARRRALAETPSLATLAKGKLVPVDQVLACRARPGLPLEMTSWLDQLAREFQGSQAAASETVQRLKGMASASARLSQSINMRFLYDRRAQDVRRRLPGRGTSQIHQPL